MHQDFDTGKLKQNGNLTKAGTVHDMTLKKVLTKWKTLLHRICKTCNTGHEFRIRGVQRAHTQPKIDPLLSIKCSGKVAAWQSAAASCEQQLTA